MEIFNMSFGSWMLMGLVAFVTWSIADLIAKWLTPKILRWYRRKKGGDVDGYA